MCSTTDTKDKTGNHQSHFNSHRSPSSQAERLAMKSVLTGQHVLSYQYLFKERVFPSMLGRFNAVQRGCMAWVYLSFTERAATHANIYSQNITTHTNKFSQDTTTHPKKNIDCHPAPHTFFAGIAVSHILLFRYYIHL